MENITNLNYINEIIKDKNKLLTGANDCDKAYWNGIGKPEYYKHFEIDTDEFLTNVPGLRAIVTTITSIAAIRGSITTEEIDVISINILNDIIENKLSYAENVILAQLFNLAWNVDQTRRNRFQRVNVFTLLDIPDQNKDIHQAIAAAKWLLAEIYSLKA